MATGRVSPSSHPQQRPPRSQSPRRPIHYATLAEGLDAVRRIGLKIVHPVDQFVLSRLWQTHDTPDPSPTWSQWQDTVRSEAHKLVAYLEGFKLFAGGEVALRQFALVTYRRMRDAHGEWVMADIHVTSADRLEDLVPDHVNDSAGHLWLRQCEKTMFYDVIDMQGDGVDELQLWSPPPRPPAIFKAGRTLSPDARALEEARRRLQQLLAGESFGQISISKAEPLFTPAELKRVEPLVTVSMPLRTDVRGFAPTALAWKELAIPPTDTIPAQPVDLPEFIGSNTFLPEPPMAMVVAGYAVFGGAVAATGALIVLAPELELISLSLPELAPIPAVAF